MFTRRSLSVTTSGNFVHRREHQLNKLFISNMFTSVNTASFHSSHSGVTCRSANPMRKHRAGKM
jgi:hypothetical protein